jgi:hypothetical protein
MGILLFISFYIFVVAITIISTLFYLNRFSKKTRKIALIISLIVLHIGLLYVFIVTRN